MKKPLLISLAAALLFSGCQQQSGPAPNATNSPAVSATASTPQAQGLELKIEGGRDMSFTPVSGWADLRGDIKQGTIAIGNYDFVVTPRNISSVPDVTEGQHRVVFGVKSPEGATFEDPMPPGDYETLGWTDVVYFEDGRQQRYNFSEPKGKVTIKEVTDTEVVGSVDLTDDKGAVVKGDFRVKKAVEGGGAAGGGKLPFDFPATEPNVKPGDTVLTPMASKVSDAMAMGKPDVGSFRPNKVVKVGPENSTIDDHGREHEIPNSLIIPLSAEAKAKAGDIVLSYPEYGDMTVAIVTDASDPTKPQVHFFKKVFGDKQPEGDKFNGTLGPGTFRVLGDDLEAGVHVTYPGDKENGFGQVINVSGDKVLVEKFGGDLEVFDKTDLTAFPVKPSLKVGDKVEVPFGKGTDPATVTKIDEKIGRVWVEFEGRKDSESVFAYGEVLPAQ